MAEEMVRLGQSDVYVSPLGTGTWAWGDKLVWGFGSGYSESEVQAAFDASVAAGVTFFDTAEIYGRGKSERLLGEAIRRSGLPTSVATKFMPYPWRFTRGALKSALLRSLDRLGLERVDLYQVHWPVPVLSVEAWAEALADVVDVGLVRAVGVSNYTADQMRRTHEVLTRRGIPLASNQVEYSLLHRKPEQNGLLETCRELGVTLIAYSPLAQGLLTGKYTPGNPPPGVRGVRYSKGRLQGIRPLISLLQELGEKHGGKTPAQVALNWTMAKGTLPIPGAKDARQVRANVGALGWRLTADDIAALDAVSP